MLSEPGTLCLSLREKPLDVSHDLPDALFLLEDAHGELVGRQVGDVLLGPRVFAVEVAAVGEQFGGGDLPGPVVLLALGPPRRRDLPFVVLASAGPSRQIRLKAGQRTFAASA